MVFIGTPFRGADDAVWKDLIKTLLCISKQEATEGGTEISIDAAVMEYCDPRTELLTIARSKLTRLASETRIPLHCFYECETSTPSKIIVRHPEQASKLPWLQPSLAKKACDPRPD